MAIAFKITNCGDKTLIIHDNGVVEGLKYFFSSNEPQCIINYIPKLIQEAKNPPHQLENKD